MTMKASDDRSDGLSTLIPEMGSEKLVSLSNERQECEVSVDTNSLAGIQEVIRPSVQSNQVSNTNFGFYKHNSNNLEAVQKHAQQNAQSLSAKDRPRSSKGITRE